MPIIVLNGEITLKDQMKEYITRGTELENSSFLDFFLNTYEGEQSTSSRKDNETRGRKASERVEYLEDAGREGRRRVIRAEGHETMVEFIGEWFPRNDNPEEAELYAAWMLALLIPWRKLEDIAGEDQMFSVRFERFKTNMNERTKDRLRGIQYYWECIDGTKKRREEESSAPARFLDVEEHIIEEDVEYDESNGPMFEFTEGDVESALQNEFSQDQRLYAEVGMNIANEAKIFECKENPMKKAVSKRATWNDTSKHQRWDEAVKAISKRDNGQEEPDHSSEIDPAKSISEREIRSDPNVDAMDEQDQTKQTHLDFLNENQRQAHDIVVNRLRAHLNGSPSPQLLMIVIGSGGTGKSTFVNAITKTFENLGAANSLFKCALSGVAASLIGGTTYHWWGGLPVGTTPQSDDWMDRSSKLLKERRQANIGSTGFLTVDETSMLTTSLLTLGSQVSGRIRAGDGSVDSTVPFGGMNVILTGDFHQFEPVGRPHEALYSQPIPGRPEKKMSTVGRNLYSQFDTVVILTEQKRTDDEVWTHLLEKIRVGECDEDDIKMLKGLIVTRPDSGLWTKTMGRCDTCYPA